MEFKKKKQEEAKKLKEMQAKAAGKGPLGKHMKSYITFVLYDTSQTFEIVAMRYLCPLVRFLDYERSAKRGAKFLLK